MIRNVEIIVDLLLLLIAIICIFNARVIAKNKFKEKNENRVVDIIRVISYIVCVGTLFVFYYLK